VGVAENLHFDVARGVDEVLQEHRPVTEGRLGFTLSAFDCFEQVVAGPHYPHTAAPAAIHRLHQQRKPDLFGRPTEQRCPDLGVVVNDETA